MLIVAATFWACGHLIDFAWLAHFWPFAAGVDSVYSHATDQLARKNRRVHSMDFLIHCNRRADRKLCGVPIFWLGVNFLDWKKSPTGATSGNLTDLFVCYLLLMDVGDATHLQISIRILLLRFGSWKFTRTMDTLDSTLCANLVEFKQFTDFISNFNWIFVYWE